MKKNILWLIALLFPIAGLLSSCGDDDDIVFDHEQPMFEIQEGKILLEVILPTSTTEDDEVYISGAFNGDDDAAVIGNEQYKLLHTDYRAWRRGIYVDPAMFQDGKTLADGFHFVSTNQREEVTLTNEPMVRRLNVGAGTRTNVYVDRWAAYFDVPEEEVDYYIPYLDDANEESIFYETDAEYVRIWCWNGVGGPTAMNIAAEDWNLRPFMEKVGKTKEGKNVFKFVFNGAPGNFLVSESDADGNQIGSDDDRPIKGAVYTKNGYYIKGVDYDGGTVPEVITRVGAPAGGSNYYTPYLDNANEESIFYETDAEYVRIWCWNGVGGPTAMNIAAEDWNLRPFMEKVGKTKEGKNVFKFVFNGAPGNFLVSESDADGNQIGSDDDRPIKGAVYTKNGYYIKGVDYDGGAVPEVITRVGAPAGGSNYYTPYLDNANEESIFYETDAEYVRIWCWNGVGGPTAMNIAAEDWNLRPFMEKVGKTKGGKNVFKFVFNGAPGNFLVSESDADGNQIGSDDDRPIKGAVYTKNGYYIKGVDYDGGAVPEVITKVK